MAEIKKINTQLQPIDKLLDTSGDAGTSGQVLSTTGSGTNWIDNDQGSVTGTGADQQVTYWTGSSVIDGDAGFKYNKSSGGYAAVTISSASSPQLCFVETGSAYTDSMRIVRGSDKLYLTYGHNANEEAITIVGGTGSDLGYVGINETSPQNTLHVQGTFRVGPWYATSDRDHFLVTPGGSVTTVSTPNENVNYDNSAGSTHIRTNSGYNTPVERLTVLSGGNVGIGVVDPDSKLEIKGTGSSTGLTLKTTDSSGNTGFWAQDGGATGVHYYPFVVGMDHDDAKPSDTLFYAKPSVGTDVGLFVKTDGNVGIGNTDPDFNANATNLVVGSGSGSQGITIFTGQNAGDYGSIYFADGQADGAEEYRGMITYEQNAEIMRFHTNTVEALELGVTQNATFAGSVTATSFSSSAGATFNPVATIEYSDISTGENRGLRIINTGGTDQQWNITAGITGQENESFCIRDATADVNVFTMAMVTGNALLTGNIEVNGTTIDLDSAASASYIADRANDTSGATYEYKTAGSLKWYTGLRGLSNDDFYLFNNAASTNALIITASGSHATFAGSIGTTGDMVLKSDSISCLTMWDSGGVGLAKFHGTLKIPDKLEHDGDDNTYLSFSAADNIKLVTGGTTALHAHDNGSVYLYTSGTQRLATVGASITNLSGGIEVTSTISGDDLTIELDHDTDNRSGTVINIGQGSYTAGKIYANNEGWEEADAGDPNATFMLGLCVGVALNEYRLLLNGIYDTGGHHGFTIGSPLYISTTSGNFTATAPSGGDYARVVGYAMSISNIYFCPDNTWVLTD